MYLFFDTETSGLPHDWNAPVDDIDNWPRLVQIAWILCNDHGTIQETQTQLIKPDGFVIGEGARRTHGITTEMALEHGVQLAPVLDGFLEVVEHAHSLVAHNIDFDAAVVGAELIRAKRENLIPTKTLRCTMREATEFCALPGNPRFKWPRLEQLHVKLFGGNFAGAHDAAADTQACQRCFFELLRRGVLGHSS